jgi:plasmid stabilization system protein ParE
MKSRVHRILQAWRDLEEIADYLAKDNLEAAFRFYDATEAAFNHLARMPNMGATRTFRNRRWARSECGRFRNLKIG